ncbi:MAG: hypothetical protein KF724_12805 [Phycisphaeraceae bacterium]|nr:hypothetical protein [Phycisphaeraceae bacterium]
MSANTSGAEVSPREPVPIRLDLLPHREPFLLLSAASRAGDEMRGSWRLSGSEPFFQGHFPGQPVLPGVLLTEALAQLAGLSLISMESADRSVATAPTLDRASPPTAVLVAVDMRLREVVRPPAVLSLEATLDRWIGPIAEFEVAALVGERRVAQGRLSLRVMDIDQ